MVRIEKFRRLRDNWLLYKVYDRTYIQHEQDRQFKDAEYTTQTQDWNPAEEQYQAPIEKPSLQLRP